VPGFDLGLVSDDIFALHQLPRRIAVIGGGYIAVEFAGLLRALGSEVTLHVRNRMLTDFDAELVDALGERMRDQGIAITGQVQVTGLHREGEEIVIDDEVNGPCGPYDAVLWAVGRTPNSDRLDLDAAGVHADEGGHVVTDAWQTTNVPGISAVGDVTERPQLTPVAVAAGRRLADRLFGRQPDSRLDYENIPTVVFAEPPLAMIGMTEAQAREFHGDQVHVYRARFTPLQWAVAGHSVPTLMKILCVGEDERVVGIHVLGPGADEMLQGFAVAMKMGLRKRDLDATVAIHPIAAPRRCSSACRTTAAIFPMLSPHACIRRRAGHRIPIGTSVASTSRWRRSSARASCGRSCHVTWSISIDRPTATRFIQAATKPDWCRPWVSTARPFTWTAKNRRRKKFNAG
jgi:glutathione reductase (NADPH)